MSIQDLGAIGEFFGLFAILFTLFYLAKQTRLSVELSRGRETRAIIDQFNEYLRRMTEPAHLEPMRKALHSFRTLTPDEQAVSFVIFVQWVNFYEQCLYAYQSGLLAEAVRDALRAYVVGFLITPGGAEFWEDYRHVFGRDVSTHLDELVKDSANHPSLITETYPWLLTPGSDVDDGSEGREGTGI